MMLHIYEMEEIIVWCSIWLIKPGFIKGNILHKIASFWKKENNKAKKLAQIYNTW